MRMPTECKAVHHGCFTLLAGWDSPAPPPGCDFYEPSVSPACRRLFSKSAKYGVTHSANHLPGLEKCPPFVIVSTVADAAPHSEALGILWGLKDDFSLAGVLQPHFAAHIK